MSKTKEKGISGKFVSVIRGDNNLYIPITVKLENGKVIEIIDTEDENLKQIAIETAKTYFIKHIMWVVED